MKLHEITWILIVYLNFQPMGIFAILEEQSMFPKATDQSFNDMLKTNLLGKYNCFMKVESIESFYKFQGFKRF